MSTPETDLKTTPASAPSPCSAAVLDAKWLDPECRADGCQSLKWKQPPEQCTHPPEWTANLETHRWCANCGALQSIADTHNPSWGKWAIPLNLKPPTERKMSEAEYARNFYGELTEPPNK